MSHRAEVHWARSDERFMRRAMQLAHLARQRDEVPVGAVVVVDGDVVGEGWNCPIGTHDPTAHAEIRALREAAQAVGNYRLPQATVYTTLEPCPMCAGAMVHARIARLVFAALDPKNGAAGSVFDLLQSERLNHRVSCESGLLAGESAALLKSFFASRRLTG